MSSTIIQVALNIKLQVLETPDEQIVEQTKKWINTVVIGCNFCPFAARVVKQDSIHYTVTSAVTLKDCLYRTAVELERLDNNPDIETSFLIFRDGVPVFEDFLHLLDLAEKLLKKSGYNGIYQIASFHPLYRFADSVPDDAANFTNRSIFPMLHFLRESAIDKALEHYDSPESIPENNIRFARDKGIEYMKLLRDSCAPTHK